MKKQNIKDRISKFTSILLAICFGAILQSTPPQVIAQSREVQSKQSQGELANILLPDSPGGEWRAVDRTRILKSEEWDILPDAAIYNEYGLERIYSRVYGKGNAKATVEIFEMRYPSGAFGLFTFNRGSLSTNRREFYSGSYLMSIESGVSDQSLDSSLIETLKRNIPNQSGNLPMLPSHLPEQNKIAGSEKYLVGPAALAQLASFSSLKEVIKFDGGVEIAVADYKNGDGAMSLMIIEYHTPQTAADGHKSATKYIDSLSQNDKGSRILKKVGNYLVHAINVKNTDEASSLIGQIKYDYKVYWEGKKLTDIPIDFRPPDPVAIEEANRTLMIMVRSFYWVGALLTGSILLGLLAGGTFFYYRRYRRRKLGLDDLFSDAGGAVRLNLDDYLLQPGQPAIKQLGDGSK